MVESSICIWEIDFVVCIKAFVVEPYYIDKINKKEFFFIALLENDIGFAFFISPNLFKPQCYSFIHFHLSSCIYIMIYHKAFKGKSPDLALTWYDMKCFACIDMNNEHYNHIFRIATMNAEELERIRLNQELLKDVRVLDIVPPLIGVWKLFVSYSIAAKHSAFMV